MTPEQIKEALDKATTDDLIEALSSKWSSFVLAARGSVDNANSRRYFWHGSIDSAIGLADIIRGKLLLHVESEDDAYAWDDQLDDDDDDDDDGHRHHHEKDHNDD